MIIMKLIMMNTSFIERKSDNVIKTSSGPITADIFINAAGGYADKIAHNTLLNSADIFFFSFI